MLLNVAGSNVELSDVTMRLAKLQDDWQNLELAVDAFNEMVEEQRSAIRSTVEDAVSAAGWLIVLHRGYWWGGLFADSFVYLDRFDA